MMSFTRLLILILATTLSSFSAHAFQRSEPEPQAFTYGAFRLSPGYGLSSILNQDGSKAIFGGPSVYGEFEIIFSVEELGMGISPYIHYAYSQESNMKNQNGFSQELRKSDLLYGLKAYVNPFYAGFGYGSTSAEVSLMDGTIRKMKLESTMLGFTAGVRLFGIGGDWSVGLAGWYKTSFFSKSKNPSLTENTVMENLELHITFTLDPLFQLL